MMRAVVIGGGPAGAALGIALGRTGWSVTIIEARAFPRLKVCGEFISPAATPLLESLVRPDELRAAGARRVDRLVLELGERETEWALPSPAWALGRGALDALLLEMAQAAGARVWQPATVRDVVYSQDTVQVRLADGRAIESEVVIHADGSGRHDPAGPVPTRPGVIGQKCHLRPPAAITGVRMRAAAGAYVGTIGIEDGLTTCALVAKSSLVAAHGGNADAMLAALWPRYDPEWRVSEWKSCGVGNSAYIAPGHWRSLRIGNAAGAVEPIGGEGIGMALWAGATLGEGLRAAAGDGPLNERSLRGVERRLAREYRRRLAVRRIACRAAAEVLMRPRLAGALWPLTKAPGLVIRPWYALTGKPLRTESRPRVRWG